MYNSAPKIMFIIWYRVNYSKFIDHFYEQLMIELIQNSLDEFVKRILDYYNIKNPITEKIGAY